MTVFVPDLTEIKRVGRWRALGLVAILSCAAQAVLAKEPTLLSVDQAFPLKARLEAQRLVLSVDILPGHYLYRDRIEIKLNGQVQEAAKLTGMPEGRARTDPHFGAVRTLEQPFQLTLRLPSARKTSARQENVEFVLDYQGCSELTGVCYPPTRRHFKLTASGREVAPEEVQRSAAPGLGQLFRKQVSQ